MKPNDIRRWFFAVVPFRRRSSIDWVLPSVVGLGIGVAAGVGVGMLLAPRPGTETRDRLREGASNLKNKAMNFADRARGQLSNASQQLTSG